MKRPPYLNVYTDRHGSLRAYFRKAGQAQVALPTPLYTEDFWKAYHRAAKGVPQTETPAAVGKAKPGSVSALIERYYRSADWNSLAPVTKESFRRVYERFRQEYGVGPVNQLTPKHVNRILDKMADRPGAAANLRKRLSTLFAYAVDDGWIETNPVSLAKRVRHVVRGIRTWSEEDITQFRKHWPLGTPQRLAMEILLYTGLRRADAVKLGPQHVANGLFVLTTSKSRGKTALMIPIHPNLRRILASAPASPRWQPAADPAPPSSAPASAAAGLARAGELGDTRAQHFAHRVARDV